MNEFKQLSVINITRKNASTFWPTVTKAIKECSFIAIDCELSGLGDRKHHKEGEIDDRYKLLCNIAKSHSIISLGISCFTCNSMSKIEYENSGSIKSHNYFVQTFNILTLCVNNYEIEYSAMKFLLSHGFDFNKQYREGLLYYKGDDIKNHVEPAVLDERSVRNIFHCVVQQGKPIVLHNGFIDLLFLYENFYAKLPESNLTFAADLASMFPNGIYDTKYIADKVSLPASYLPYVFNKLLLTNRSRQKRGQWHVNLNFPPYPANLKDLSYFSYQQVLQYKPVTNNEELCEGFKLNGWCQKGEKCTLSHNIYKIAHHLSSTGEVRGICNSSLYSTSEVIARMKSNVKRNNLMEQSPQKRFYSAYPNQGGKNAFGVEFVPEEETITEMTKQACHSAGYDAFMTGSAFASYVSIFGSLSVADEKFTTSNIDMDTFSNRIFIVGKSYPFLVDGSYSSVSKRHCKKIEGANS